MCVTGSGFGAAPGPLAGSGEFGVQGVFGTRTRHNRATVGFPFASIPRAASDGTVAFPVKPLVSRTPSYSPKTNLFPFRIGPPPHPPNCLTWHGTIFGCSN